MNPTRELVLFVAMGVTATFAVARCTAPPAPSPSASSSAAPSAAPSAQHVGPGPGDPVDAAVPPPAVTSGDASPGPVPDASSPTVRWDVMSPDLHRLQGRWVSADRGDAIPGGPFGGKIVQGGVRAEFEHNRRGSRTPWNVVWWGPKDGHTSSTTISGGCGFYDSGVAYCRGYGLKGRVESRIALMASDETPPKLQFVVADVFASGPLVKVP